MKAILVIVILLPGLIQGHHSTIHDDFLVEILGSVKRRSNYGCEANTIFQCCGSGMFMSNTVSWFLPFLDPGSRIPGSTKKRRKRPNCFSTFFVAIYFTKLKIINFVEHVKKNIGVNWQRIKVLLTQKIVTKLSNKIDWIQDLKSGIAKNISRI